MTNISTLALIAALAAAGIVRPALAQSAAPMPPVTATASHNTKLPVRHGRIYDAMPENPLTRHSDEPAATGGGSIGYNQMIYNW